MHPAPAVEYGRGWILVMGAAISSILFVLLVSQLPVAILADAAHDDAWFWRQAESIAAGHWMGDYNQMTLMKGSGYPLFLAISHALGIPLMTMQALLYAGACLLLGSAVYRMSSRPWLATLLVVALQWHPAAMAWTRVIRDNIGSSQVLVVLACLLHFLYASQTGRRGWWWAIMAGLSFAWLWSTREDGVWVVPGVVLLVLARAVQVAGDRSEIRRLGAGGVLAALAFAGWLSLVATANLAKYGVFVTVDTRESAYGDATTALQSVRVGLSVPYVPVPAEVREAIYPVSPAFASLRPHFDGAGRDWTGPGCGHYPHACGDYAGGWFMWAFRDAVASIGAYGSARSADAFYSRVAEEVGAACDDGRLRCATSFVPGMPPVTPAQWKTLPTHARSALALLVWQGISDQPAESHTRSVQVRAMWNFIGRPNVPDDADELGTWVTGWFHDTQPGWVRIRCENAGDSMAVSRQSSPDLADHFADPNAGEGRFAMAVPGITGCAVESTTGAGTVQLSDVTADVRGFSLGSGQLYFDSVLDGIPHHAKASATAQWFKTGTSHMYQAILPWLAVSGLLAFSWTTIRALRWRWREPLYILAATVWCLVAARCALLALVDMSSFPAMKVHYMQPAFPLLVVAAVVSLSLLSRDTRQIGATVAPDSDGARAGVSKLDFHPDE